MRSKAVPQGVRRNVIDAYSIGMAFDHAPGQLPREAFPAMQKQVRRSLFSITRLYRGVLLQPVDGTFAQGHATLLTSFSLTPHQPSMQINITGLQRSDFRNTQASGVHQL